MNDPGQTLERISFVDLAGWADDDIEQALVAFRLSCHEIVEQGRAFHRPVRFGGKRCQWVELCSRLGDTISARTFFETNFIPFKVHDPKRPEGLFTGYFEPEAAGRRTHDTGYDVPVYRQPPDLVPFNLKQQQETGLAYGRLIDGKPAAYFTRREIESGALRGQGLELVWLADWADAFFMQVQGSGRVRLPNRELIRLSFGAKSGQPYTGIGGLLVSRGLLAPGDVSMQTIRAWMAANPASARELMWENRSFVFFREIELKDQQLGPVGAQHVQLTPGRSLAVDRDEWMFGTPVWLQTEVAAGVTGRTEKYRRLMIAQDTGSAIKGFARGDLFWGSGADAAHVAGRMKSPGTMIVLLPVEVARDEGMLK